MQLKIASELEGNVGPWPVHGGEAIKTHSKITYFKSILCCFKAQKHVVLWLILRFYLLRIRSQGNIFLT